MLIEDNRKRTEYAPRPELPDSWAEHGRCPGCGCAPLSVVHLQGSPDYLLCKHCELSFEVEQGRSLIRLKNIPDQLGFIESEIRHRWVRPDTLERVLKERQVIMQQKALAQPPRGLADDEVWERMLGLYRLGNQARMVEFMVIQAGATREQAQAGSLRLQKWIEANNRSQNIHALTVAALTMALILGLVLGSWYFAGGIITARLNAGSGSQTQKAILPVDVLKAVPDGLKPAFLKSPAPLVENSGPAAAHCPRSAADAAALFGGDARYWQTASQADSWQMLQTGNPVTIRVPKGMYAGYIDNTTFIFSSANGPATVHNINFVAIMCN